MKITLDIPDGVICAFLNGVQMGCTGMEMFSYQLDGDDLVDGKETKLPRTLPTTLPNPVLEEMELSVRCYNVLKIAGLKTAQDIAKLDYTQLIRIRNIGKHTYDEIISKMEALGYNTDKMKPGVEQ